MKKLFALLFILSLILSLTGCAELKPSDFKPYWDAFQKWNDEYGQTKPPAPVNPVKPPEKPSDQVKPPEQPTGTLTGNIVVLDLADDVFPPKMCAAGWCHPNVNANYYVGVCKMGSGWTWPPHEVDEISKDWYPQQDKIAAWFDSLIVEKANQLKANPGLTATVIGGDAHDRCGSRVGPVIMQRLEQLGVDMSRVQMGSVYNP